MKSADFYIEKLNLIEHPEGGFFSEVYRSEEKINKDALPNRYSGDRSFATSIYFLLKGNQKSYFHKLRSDEIWHFYDGSTIKLNIIDKNGNYSEISIGRDIERGEVLQFVIKKEHWFCAEVINKNSYSLIGCTVSPGFDFADFELGKRKTLLKMFPQSEKVISDFTLQ